MQGVALHPPPTHKYKLIAINNLCRNIIQLYFSPPNKEVLVESECNLNQKEKNTNLYVKW